MDNYTIVVEFRRVRRDPLSGLRDYFKAHVAGQPVFHVSEEDDLMLAIRTTMMNRYSALPSTPHPMIGSLSYDIVLKDKVSDFDCPSEAAGGCPGTAVRDDMRCEDCGGRVARLDVLPGADPCLNPTPTCAECYGTGHRMGFGAPCSRGCRT